MLHSWNLTVPRNLRLRRTHIHRLVPRTSCSTAIGTEESAGSGTGTDDVGDGKGTACFYRELGLDKEVREGVKRGHTINSEGAPISRYSLGVAGWVGPRTLES